MYISLENQVKMYISQENRVKMYISRANQVEMHISLGNLEKQIRLTRTLEVSSTSDFGMGLYIARDTQFAKIAR